MYEVTYFSLNQIGDAALSIRIVQQAKYCLEERMNSRGYRGRLQYDTTATEPHFTVRSEERSAIEALPASLGSPMGQFGQFDRLGRTIEAGDVQIIYALKPFARSYRLAQKQRLTIEIANRLQVHLDALRLHVEVSPDTANLQIVVSASSSAVIDRLPLTFNAVFELNAVFERYSVEIQK